MLNRLYSNIKKLIKKQLVIKKTKEQLVTREKINKIQEKSQ